MNLKKVIWGEWGSLRCIMLGPTHPHPCLGFLQPREGKRACQLTWCTLCRVIWDSRLGGQSLTMGCWPSFMLSTLIRAPWPLFPGHHPCSPAPCLCSPALTWPQCTCLSFIRPPCVRRLPSFALPRLLSIHARSHSLVLAHCHWSMHCLSFVRPRSILVCPRFGLICPCSPLFALDQPHLLSIRARSPSICARSPSLVSPALMLALFIRPRFVRCLPLSVPARAWSTIFTPHSHSSTLPCVRSPLLCIWLVRNHGQPLFVRSASFALVCVIHTCRGLGFSGLFVLVHACSCSLAPQLSTYIA